MPIKSSHNITMRRETACRPPKLYNQSKQFYDLIGINRRLDKKKSKSSKLSNPASKMTLETTIARLLSGNSTRNGYA
ncbi:MAG: hypothetical protein ACLSHR_11550 [Oscillospiraceae bacterium]